MDRIKKLLLENKAWAQGKVDVNPTYFKDMARDQSPSYLWIGCADSRVPPSEITNSDPGDMFVHRNIANLVVHTDMNLLSVLQYAVHHLNVPHVIVCGHYGCGGVKAALSNQSLGLLDNWVRNIKDTYFFHKTEIDSIQSESDRVNRLVEMNVLEQVRNLAHSSIIQSAWAQKKLPNIHGWVYDLSTGKLKEIAYMNADSQVDSSYKFNF